MSFKLPPEVTVKQDVDHSLKVKESHLKIM